MSDSPKQNFDYDIFAKPPKQNMNKKPLRYALVLIGLILVANGFYIYTHPLVPTGTSQYSIGNHAYETEIYSTSPILQFLGLTCVAIGISFAVYALVLLKTNPKPQAQK